MATAIKDTLNFLVFLRPRSLTRWLVGFAALLSTLSCGRGPASLIRYGQAPIYDFPMYVSLGAPGQILKFYSNGSREVFYSGLNDPRGLATDRFGNLFVVEQGANRLLKIDTITKNMTVIASNLSTPSVVAVNSFGEAYVAQDGEMNIIRAADKKVFATFSSIPSALAFGVNDIPIVGLFSDNLVRWGFSGPSASVANPVMVATDGTGRVFVAEGTFSGARVVRYHQRSPGDAVVVADALSGPTGIAVDPVGNIYIVEQGAARIVLVTYKGELFQFAGSVLDPYYAVFTQY